MQIQGRSIRLARPGSHASTVAAGGQSSQLPPFPLRQAGAQHVWPRLPPSEQPGPQKQRGPGAQLLLVPGAWAPPLPHCLHSTAPPPACHPFLEGPLGGVPYNPGWAGQETAAWHLPPGLGGSLGHDMRWGRGGGGHYTSPCRDRPPVHHGRPANQLGVGGPYFCCCFKILSTPPHPTPKIEAAVIKRLQELMTQRKRQNQTVLALDLESLGNHGETERTRVYRQ
ncbi:unnamed protein product [Nyctereutes procyonoides]|uniref:(raccoon dog) hypothetical protein n=1 Tax=Nyctereutes procyonoides TaxID=34880 RepID=A0A811YNH8_NYCPR|nr:unnamed protein product [Nyctereutes procyonoides]